ncbi:MAG: thiol reductant ABC exporter subunit CydC, partial [Desulfonatronovibrio sp. MSAO_Bac4]
MKVFLPLLKLLLNQWKWMLLGVVCSAITLLANAALLSVAAWFLACMALAGISGVPFNYHLPAGGIRTLAIVRTLGRYAERLVSHQ